MSKNSESLNRSLYDLLRGKGYKPKMLTTAGKASPVPEDASVFLFNFVKDGTDYGQVSVSIDGSKKLIVYYDDEVENSPSTNTSGTDVSDSWSSLVQHLSQWRFRNGLRSFELKNQDHLESDMAQREYMRKKESVTEGYHPLGKQASYNDNINNAKIIIQHSRKLEEGEQRYRNIARIFVENANGERFLLPTTKPGIAQVYARHIAEGGTPYDDKAQHINSLVEEHTKMAGFVRATRNGQFNESTQRLVQEGINHYQSLRECLSKMRTHRGYQAYFESWTPSLMEDELDESVNELFVQETMDPRIESVLPILSKLQKNISETTTMKEVDQLAEWADSLLEGGDGSEASEEEDIDTDGAAGEGTAEEVDDDENITEGMLDGSGEIDSPVANAITRRILLQRTDLLAKYGPEKVADAIGNIAADLSDWIGPDDEIGSSDVSGWVKRVEQELGGGQLEESHMSEVDMIIQDVISGELDAYDVMNNPKTNEEKYVADMLQQQYEEVSRDHRLHPDDDFEQILDIVVDNLAKDYGHPEDPNQVEEAGKPGLWANIHAKRERIKHGSGEKMRKPGSKGAPSAQDFKDAAKESIGDVAKKVGSAVKAGAKAVGKAIVGPDDDELLQNLKKAAGVRNPQTGKPSMAHSDVEKVDEEGVAEAAKWRSNPDAHYHDYDSDQDYGKKRAMGDFSDTEDELRGRTFKDVEGGKLTKRGSDYRKTYIKRSLGKHPTPNLPEQGVAEGEFAGDYKTGPEGQWRNKGPKANKPATIGDLVGENFINTDAQAVVSEMDSEGYKGTRDDDNKGPEGKATPIKAKDMAKDAEKKLEKHMDKAHKKDVKEGQEDLDAILRIINR